MNRFIERIGGRGNAIVLGVTAAAGVALGSYLVWQKKKEREDTITLSKSGSPNRSPNRSPIKIIEDSLKSAGDRVASSFNQAKTKVIHLIGDDEGEVFTDPQYDVPVSLYKSDALNRSSVISNVKYSVNLSLPKGEKYKGIARITFELKEVQHGLFLDFQSLKIFRYLINDKKVTDPECFRDQKLYLQKDFLTVGMNTVDVKFESSYSNNGEGLHHFVDPEDNEEYLYTQFEPFNAHRVFPCFDQPDIKAQFKLKVIAELSWEVISNEMQIFAMPVNSTAAEAVIKASKIDEDMLSDFDEAPKLHVFGETDKISTYLYAIIAGPYDHFLNDKGGYVPMRIFCRKSLAKYVDYKEFFLITMAGMDFYKEFFGVAYPFKKYDQIYCPEFNFGAMENVGAVTYTEFYVFKDPPTVARKTRFCNTILHELAHMWFGNLVTMKWWSDLWLNESFATYMAYLCQSKAKGLEHYTTAWLTFLAEKAWGYKTDQLSTTHPIATNCEHTEDAENTFDGISYAKGSSFLKQMTHLISEEVLSHGMKNYFKTFAWKNTELKDFIGTLHESCKQFEKTRNLDLTSWSDVWLKTSGVNSIEPIIEEENGIIKSFKIKQSPAKHGDKNLRMQIIDIGIFNEKMEETVISNVKMLDQEYTEVKELSNKPVPAAIYLNINDHGYCKVIIDKKSFEMFSQNIEKVRDDLTRAMLWRSFWDMVRDRKLPATKYVDIVKNKLVYEKVQETVMTALLVAHSACAYYIPIGMRMNYYNDMFDFVLDVLLTKETSSNTKIALLDQALGFLADAKRVNMALQWIDDGVSDTAGNPIDVALSQKNRYSIVRAVFSIETISKPEKYEHLQKQLDKDKSDIGVMAKHQCEASLPEIEQKERLWHWYLNRSENKKESVKMISASMSHFHSWKNMVLTQKYIDLYFEHVEKVFYETDRQFAVEFYGCLSPSFLATEDIANRYKAILGRVKPERTFFIQLLKDTIENIEMWREAQELCDSSLI